jgi:hypothetical protein
LLSRRRLDHHSGLTSEPTPDVHPGVQICLQCQNIIIGRTKFGRAQVAETRRRFLIRSEVIRPSETPFVQAALKFW